MLQPPTLENLRTIFASQGTWKLDLPGPCSEGKIKVRVVINVLLYRVEGAADLVW